MSTSAATPVRLVPPTDDGPRSLSLSIDVLSSDAPVVSGSAHPLTRFIYGLLRDRSPADMRMVLEAVARRLGPVSVAAKRVDAYRAMDVFVRRFSYVPSPSEYERWRKSGNGVPDGQRSMTFVRNAFGNWAAVRDAFSGDIQAVDVFAHRELLARGSVFSRDALLRIVGVWSDSVSGPLVQYDSLQWCSTAVTSHPDVDRAPRDWGPFRRVFGSWDSVLEEAGLEHRQLAAEVLGGEVVPRWRPLVALLSLGLTRLSAFRAPRLRRARAT